MKEAETWEVQQNDNLGTAVRSVEHLQMVGSVPIFLHFRGGVHANILEPLPPSLWLCFYMAAIAHKHFDKGTKCLGCENLCNKNHRDCWTKWHCFHQ